MNLQYKIIADVISLSGRQVTVNIITTGDAGCDLFLKITPQSPYSITYNVDISATVSTVIATVESQLTSYIDNVKTQLAAQNTIGLGGQISL